MTRIPRSCTSRRTATYALLVRRVLPRKQIPFEGKLLRTGVAINDCELRPEGWPARPLLIEFAGREPGGWGHRRANDIHVLWRFESARSEWVEIVRIASQGFEWTFDMKPIVMRELSAGAGTPDAAAIAHATTGRILSIVDQELDALDDEARDHALSTLYEQFAARLMSEAA